ncbi:MAG: rod-binding protein [Spirochaetales bacterium]|nr:rod-binding protein [Spirochaetales bacterium]
MDVAMNALSGMNPDAATTGYQQKRVEQAANALKRSGASPSGGIGLGGGRSSSGVLDENQRLKNACRDFEAIFLKQMLSAMRDTVPEGGLIEGGMAESMFEDMLYDEYATKMADVGEFGLQDMLYDELSRTTGSADPAHATDPSKAARSYDAASGSVF